MLLSMIHIKSEGSESNLNQLFIERAAFNF